MNYYKNVSQIQFCDLETVKDLAVNIKHDGNIFIDITWEGNAFDTWSVNYYLFMYIVRRLNPNSYIYVIANSTHYPDAEKFERADIDDILFVDYFLYRVYRQIVCKRVSEISPYWNPQNTKFLMLTGKPRQFRLDLLKKLIDRDLLKHAEYSLHLGPSAEDDTLKSYERNPDGIDIARTWPHYGGIPYDVRLYHNALFQIITETKFELTSDSRWITEKTWLSIANRRPFILAGDTGTLDLLSNLGFHTFRQHLPNYDYNDLNDYELKLQAIVDNASYWLEHINGQADIINQEIEDNYNQFIKLAKFNEFKIDRFIAKHDLECSAEQLVPTGDWSIHDPWRNFYERVKADHWPEFMPFDQLPKDIQEECVEQFGWLNGQ